MAPAIRRGLGGIAAVVLLAVPATAGAARLYVPDSRTSSGKIFEYTIGSGGALSPTVPGTVPSVASDAPTQLSLTPDGQFAYGTHTVTNKSIEELAVDGSGTLSLLSGSPLTVTNALTNVAVAPNGVDLYVAERTSSGAVRHARIQADGQLSALDSIVAAPNTNDVVVTPDGRFVYAANDGGSVSRYTVNGNGTLTGNGSTTVGSGLESLAVSPDSQKLFVGSTGDGKVYSFQINSDGTLTAPATASIAGGGFDMAISPAGDHLYSTGGSSVYQFQINSDSSLTALSPASVSSGGTDAQGIEVSPDGLSVYAVNRTGGGVAQYDVGSGGALSSKTPATVVPDTDTSSRPFGAAVTPAQGVAGVLTATSAGGSTFDFDASGSTSPNGTITGYEFFFGDGTSATGSSPTVSHTYGAPGTYTAEVIATDSTGATSRQVYTGHSTLINGQPGVATVTVAGSGGGGGGGGGGTTTTTTTTNNTGTAGPTIAGVTIQGGGAPQIVPGQGPAPILGQTLVATPLAKGVRVRPPGSSQFVPLEEVSSLPVGSVVDAQHGKLRLTAAIDALGHTESAAFYGGIFKALQQTGGGVQKAAVTKPVVELRLIGSLGTCTSSAKKSAHEARRRRSRHLWGDGHGSFRTRGRYASATVRGTKWLTKDSCDGTLTVVRRGIVLVRDLVRHKNVKVKAGHRLLVRPVRR